MQTERIRDQISENTRRSRGFSPAREFLLTLPRFSPGYEGKENMLYLFYKNLLLFIIFRLNKEKDDRRSVYVYFNFFHETVNSHNLETANHIAHVIFMLHSTMKRHL